jgi:DNA-binding response OmpR family regulator
MAIRVLLSDPEEMLLQAYRRFLARQGFEVETTSSRTDCLTKLSVWKPDVLVLEPDTPDGWGESILAEVARQPGLSKVEVLILSRNDLKQTSFPVREYHVKPFSMVKLAESIRAAVGGGREVEKNGGGKR